MPPSTSREDFNKVFPALVQDISEHAKEYNIPAPALEWLQKVSLARSSLAFAVTNMRSRT